MITSEELMGKILGMTPDFRFGNTAEVPIRLWDSIVGALICTLNYHRPETDGYDRCLGCKMPWPCPDFENVAEIYGETFGS